MKIHDPLLQFKTWLNLASFLAVKFAQNYVKQTLAYDFKYELQLNMANDDLAKGDFDKCPEDDNKVINYENIDDVSKELVRKGKIPVWVDISVNKHSKNFTLLRLICAGRFTDDIEELYYYSYGTGCFGVKSPDLPPAYKDGSKFKIEKA